LDMVSRRHVCPRVRLALCAEILFNRTCWAATTRSPMVCVLYLGIRMLYLDNRKRPLKTLRLKKKKQREVGVIAVSSAGGLCRYWGIQTRACSKSERYSAGIEV